MLTSLDQFVTAREADPRGFHDTSVESAYRVFLTAAHALLKSTDEGMFPMKRRADWSEIPSEWYDEDHRRWDKAHKQILETWNGFLDARDDFLLSAHGALLNEPAAAPAPANGRAGSVSGNTFNGPVAFQVGNHNQQNVRFDPQP